MPEAWAKAGLLEDAAEVRGPLRKIQTRARLQTWALVVVQLGLSGLMTSCKRLKRLGGRKGEAHVRAHREPPMTPISTVLTRTAIRLARQTLRRSLATHVTPTVTLHVPRGSTVFQYGHSSRNGGRARPLLALPAQAWTIEQDERWAVVGAGKDRQILLDVSNHVSSSAGGSRAGSRRSLAREPKLTSPSRALCLPSCFSPITGSHHPSHHPADTHSFTPRKPKAPRPRSPPRTQSRPRTRSFTSPSPSHPRRQASSPTTQPATTRSRSQTGSLCCRRSSGYSTLTRSMEARRARPRRDGRPGSSGSNISSTSRSWGSATDRPGGRDSRWHCSKSQSCSCESDQETILVDMRPPTD